ncbi:MAG: alkaline phosphatase [Acidobacteria bacterium]|nr:alkaline phosphatase [Acidobacteriota bacterium]
MLLLVAVTVCGADRAKNVILFIGDAGGLSTLHAASAHRHGEPAKLFVQRMSNPAFSDTSSASDWVTDSAARMTAIVTGVKTHNRVTSQGPEAVRGEKDGPALKTILEYAEERGLSTGVVSNSSMADATPAACYAHVSNRKMAGEVFSQILTPTFGDGVDVVLGPGRKAILDGTQQLKIDLAAGLKKKGYYIGEALASVPADANRAIVLSDDSEFDIHTATELAIRILSRNKKGYFLMVESDLHASPKNVRCGLERAAKFDDLIQGIAGSVKDTLVMFTAGHSSDFRIAGVAKRDASFFTEADGKLVPAKSVSVNGHHSAEQVLVAAQGPGSQRVKGFLANTDLFHIMLGAYGWMPASPTQLDGQSRKAARNCAHGNT